MRRLIIVLAVFFCLSTTAGAADARVDNDAGCDIGVLPAATLLLPYFEVDLNAPPGTGETTIFTITNTDRLPQAVHVTLWTDYGYPVIDFNLFLTGYDVQSINLYDVIKRGQLAPDNGTGFDVSPVGELSGDAWIQRTFDNPLLDESTCFGLPVTLPFPYIQRMQSAFTTGKVPAVGTFSPACTTAGGRHANAVGYATLDVTGLCSTSLPTEPEYFAEDIRFDNVLAGDYVQVSGSGDHAQGGPMVHIRAIPEGGTPKTRAGDAAFAVNLPRTFYGRFQSASRPHRDARQPLPATFHARWISGGPSGFETHFKIWREGRATPGTACSAYPALAAMNLVEVVRFDEEENPETLAPEIPICAPITTAPILPATSRVDVDDQQVFPHNTYDAVGGWMYVNLDYCNRDDFASQNWIISSMRAEGRFAVDADALALGNGCTAPVRTTEATAGNGLPIGPAPNVRP
jgi:hypothetical protein